MEGAFPEAWPVGRRMMFNGGDAVLLLKVHPKDPDNPNRIAYINPEAICSVHDQKMGGSLISFSNGEAMTVNESPDALVVNIQNRTGEPGK